MHVTQISYTVGFLSGTLARDIVFPASIPQVPFFTSFANDPGSAWTNVPGAVAGLTTFANSPHVFCLADAENEAVEKFDIAFLGAPFDTVRLPRLTSCSVYPCDSQ
jgi:hypothetical protein